MNNDEMYDNGTCACNMDTDKKAIIHFQGTLIPRKGPIFCFFVKWTTEAISQTDIESEDSSKSEDETWTAEDQMGNIAIVNISDNENNEYDRGALNGALIDFEYDYLLLVQLTGSMSDTILTMILFRRKIIHIWKFLCH